MATAAETATPTGGAEAVMPPGGDSPLVGSDLAVGRWDPGAEAPSKSDRYLARRLAAASADYKSVAVTTFLLGAAVAGGAWLAAGILAEHWLVPGGLSPAIRWAWLGVAVVAVAAAAVRWLVPLVRYRVNLVYAARAIEREHPELHNDLVNTVLVKAHPDSNPAKVVRSLERRTAKQLADVPVEAVIDRTVPLRLAWALAAIVGLAGLYELAAPKSLLVSAARLLAPWAGWAAPSRVRIGPPRLGWRMPAEQGEAFDALERRGIGIEAGSATLVRGRQLVVAADIRGLRRGERTEVVVAPLRADGSVDPAVPSWRADLTRVPADTAAGRVFAAILPDATRGLDQSVEISITAGDARTAPVRVAVVDSPSLLVREIRYVFPDYTRRPPETVAWQGDIRAVEGTQVTVVAESNQPLDDAWIDFDGDGRRDLRFSKSASDLARVTKSFPLRLKADGTGPEHASYRLVFQPRSATTAGRDQVITDPLEHRIEVLADVAPEVAIEEPRESPLRVPPAAPVAVRVQAHDPDFALARVGIETRVQGGAAAAEVVLLEGEHAGAYRGVARLVPERLGAGAGTTLEYRAVAVDNRPNRPNASHSPWQVLRIDPAAPPRQSEPPPSGQRSSAGDADEQRSGDDGSAGRPDKAPDGGRADSDGGEQGSKQPNERESGRASGGGKEQERDQASRDQPQAGQEKQEGKQDGRAQGGQKGDRQQQPSAAQQAGDQQGQGRNQGQGAEQGEGVGAQGERQGGAEQQSGGPGPRDQAQQGGRREAEGQEGGTARNKSVAADGTNDGEAMERILDHRREQGEKQAAAPRQGEASGQGGEQPQPSSGRDGRRNPEAAGEHDHSQCNPADGKPCGKDGCPTCKGQGSGGQPGAGGRPGSAASEGQKQEGSGAASAEGGANGAGKEGSGQASGAEAAGKEAASKEGAGKEGVGKEGVGKEGVGKEGVGKEGGTSSGAGEPGERGGHGEQTSAGGNEQTAGQQEQGQRKEGGSPAEAAPQEGSGSQPGNQAGAGQKQPGADAQAASEAGEPGTGGGETGSGGWAGGDASRRADGAALPNGPLPSKKAEWGEQDLGHAKNAADLAIEHLRQAVESGDTAVLDRLGWTRDQARAFLERWEKMRKLAESADPVERGAFERTLRSLGLRPDGVRSSRDVPSDARGGQAEGRRSRPPADYQEQFRAYTQGTSGE